MMDTQEAPISQEQKKKRDLPEQDLTNSFFQKNILPYISRELYLASQERPHKDASFIFPYEAAAQALIQAFSLESITFDREKESLWSEKETVTRNCQDSSSDLFEITLSGSAHVLYVKFPISAYSTLFSLILGNTNSLLALQDPLFFSQFRSFVLFQIFSTIKSLQGVASLTPSLQKVYSEEEKRAFSIESPFYITTIGCHVNQTFLGEIELYCPTDFFKEWKKLYPYNPEKSPTISFLNNTLQIPLSIELGRSLIEEKDLINLQEGDLFLIEHPFYKPNSEITRAILTFKGKPLFKAKIKEGTMRILEMPIQYEIFHSPGDTLSRSYNDQQSEALQQDTPSLDKEKEKEMSYRNTPSDDIHDEDNYNNDAEADHIDIGANPFEGQDPFDNDDDDTDESSSMPDAEVLEKSKSYLPPEKVNIKEIPHTVIVQLAQLNMTVEELSNLQAGTLIDLEVQPEDLVSLVIRDKVIALGNLVMIGSHVGVHIRELHTKTEE